MSIIKCLRDSNLPSRLMEEVEEQYDLFLRYNTGDTGRADAALLEWLPTYRDAFKRNRLRSALAAVELEKSIDNQLKLLKREWDTLSPAAKKWSRLVKERAEPTRINAIERLYQNAEIEAVNTATGLLGQLSKLYMKVAPRGIMLDADKRVMHDVVTGLVEGMGAVKNPETRQIVTELRKVLDDGLQIYKNAGGLIGEIENYIPVRHNSSKIGAVDFPTWYAAYRKMTDISKVRDYRTGKLVDEARFKQIAQDMYNDIVSDGATRVARQIKNGTTSSRFNNPDMFSRRMQQRLTSPVSADAFHEYNRLFGVDDEGMFDLIMSNIESIGRDAGVMKVLGPSPYAQSAHQSKMIIAGGGTKAEVKTQEALFRTLVGHWDGSVDSMLSRQAANLHNLMSSSLLGAASVAALGDRVFARHATRMHGLTGAGEMGAWFNTVMRDPDDLVRAIHIAEALSHTNISRYDGSIGITPTNRLMSGLNNLKNMNHRMSGLQQLTFATGDGMTMGFFGDISSMVSKKTKWADIPPDFRKLMERFEMSDTDWGRMLLNGTGETGFITPQTLPDNLSEVARKLNNINMQLRLYATNAPDLRQRMWTTGNRLGSQTRGDIPHLISSLVFQFKSFPMMVWRNHFVPTMTRAINNDAMPLGALLGSSIFYGMMIVQLKALLKGEEAYNLEGEFFGLNGELLARSAFQSGFAGLLGDFMFKDPEAYGRNLAAELLGPGVSTGSAAAMEMAKGLHYLASSDDDKNWDWGATIRAGKPFVPLHTLWYLRATLDHMLWDIGTAALDDDYYTNTQRRNKDMQEERGGAGWWPKGENIPVGLR